MEYYYHVLVYNRILRAFHTTNNQRKRQGKQVINVKNFFLVPESIWNDMKEHVDKEALEEILSELQEKQYIRISKGKIYLSEKPNLEYLTTNNFLPNS